MSSFLCFICHSTVSSVTNEEMREKYKEIVGINLCPNSHLCHICHHVLNRLWLFRHICLKRSLEYPVLFSEKGTLNLQRNDMEFHTICLDDCKFYNSRNLNSSYYQFTFDNEDSNIDIKNQIKYEYVALEDRHEHDDLFNNKANDCEVIQKNTNNDKDNGENFNNEQYHSAVKTEEYILIENNFEHDKDNINLIKEEAESNVVMTISQDEEIVKVSENEQELHEIYDEAADIVMSDDKDISDNDENQEDPIPPKETQENIETPKTLDKPEKKKKEKNKFKKLILSIEEQRTELEAKRKEKKYTEAEFKCYACALGFMFKDTYQAHMMRHEESNGEYQCSICGLRFATQAVIRAHTALHAERHRCLRCNLIVRRRQRKDHARLCHKLDTDTASCHLCGRVFKDSTALQQHLRRFHRKEGGRHACGVCGERGLHPAAVRTHMIKHVQRKFPCSTCGRTLSSPAARRAHARVHERAGPTCRCACGASFATLKGLRAHRASSRVHAETSVSCTICGRTLHSQRSLQAHIATVHSAVKPHCCAACPKRFATKKALTRHAASHGPRKPSLAVLCHQCGRSFKDNSKLNRHLREVCEKDKLEEELSAYYALENEQRCVLKTG